MHLEHIKIGTVLARDILDPHGQLLIRCGQTLSERHLKTLRAWGITEIEILPDGDADILPHGEEATDELRAMIDARFEISNRDHPAVDRLYQLCLRWASGQLQSVGRPG